MKKIINKKLNNNTLFEILNNFQDIATLHGVELGLDHNGILNENEFWVLVRTKFEVVKSLSSLDVELTTYPKQPGKIDYDRDYLIKTNDEINIKGISKWVIANVETRKIIRKPSVIFPKEFYNSSNFDEFNKIRYEEEKLNFIKKYNTTIEDLDKNNHVNNARYALMIESIFDTTKIQSFQIEYINEVLVNEEVSLYMYKDDYLYIVGKVNDKICFSAKIKEKE